MPALTLAPAFGACVCLLSARRGWEGAGPTWVVVCGAKDWSSKRRCAEFLTFQERPMCCCSDVSREGCSESSFPKTFSHFPALFSLLSFVCTFDVEHLIKKERTLGFPRKRSPRTKNSTRTEVRPTGSFNTQLTLSEQQPSL